MPSVLRDGLNATVNPLRARAAVDIFVADCDAALGQSLRGQLLEIIG